MATVKLFANKDDASKATGHVRVYIQLIHLTKVKYIPITTGDPVEKDHFDFVKKECKKTHPQFTVINEILRSALTTAEGCLAQLAKKTYTPDEFSDLIKNELNRGGGPTTLGDVAKGMILEFRKLRQNKSASNMEFIVKTFNEWSGGDRPICDISWQQIKDWRTYFKSQGKNCRSYFVCLNSIFNRAIAQEELPVGKNPFSKGGLLPPAVKRKEHDFGVHTIRRLLDLRTTLPLGTPTREVVDFMLGQFYCQGVAPIDLAMGRRAHIKNGIWTYERYKNRSNDSQLKTTVVITTEFQEILDDYPGDLFFPLLKDFPINPQTGRVDIESTYDWFNRKTKQIEKRSYRDKYDDCLSYYYNHVVGVRQYLPVKDGGKQLYVRKGINQLLGDDIHLTMYSMRYTWKTVAVMAGIGPDVRDYAQGHVDQRVGAGYEQNRQMWCDMAAAANRKVINLCKETKIIPLTEQKTA